VAIHDIRYLGDPVLRTPTLDVTRFGTPELHQLIEDMLETMFDAPGVGLAANQIGVGLRIFTYGIEDRVGHLINPTVEVSQELPEDGDEGCLSLPGLYYPTPRATGAVARGYDEHGAPVTLEGSGLMARCIQHEIDHLDGSLYIDRLDRAHRKVAMRDIREAQWAGQTQSHRSSGVLASFAKGS